MAGQYDQWFRRQGDASASPAALHVGKNLLGYLEDQRRLGQASTQAIRRQLGDGTVVEARFLGDQPQVRVRRPGGRRYAEETVLLYVSSDDGLRVFDLGSKREVLHMPGLEEFEVDAVSDSGKIVHMSGNWMAVRVDLGDTTAFGYLYPVAAVSGDPNGVAVVSCSIVSPDGTRALQVFTQTARLSDGLVLDGLGGVILADADTLEPVRPAIRMSFRFHQVAWSEDSQRFFVPASINSDPGDAPSVNVADSTTDYIAVFDRDGALLDTHAVATWTAPPGTSATRSVRSMVAASGRLYAMVRDAATSTAEIRVYDVVDSSGLDTFALAASVSLPFTATPTLAVDRSGSKLAAMYADGHVDSYIVGDDTIELDASTAVGAFPNDSVLQASAYFHLHGQWLQVGPRSKAGRAPDTRRFFLQEDTQVFKGYRTLDAEDPAYELELSEYAVKRRFRTINGGVVFKEAA